MKGRGTFELGRPMKRQLQGIEKYHTNPRARLNVVRLSFRRRNNCGQLAPRTRARVAKTLKFWQVWASRARAGIS